ncbi:MAG: hypothetical protein AAB447_00940, partial [Patescibacteria group bacterium]
QPGETPRQWHHRAKVAGLPPGTYRLLLRVTNPMPGGKPLRFANRALFRKYYFFLPPAAATQAGQVPHVHVFAIGSPCTFTFRQSRKTIMTNNFRTKPR